MPKQIVLASASPRRKELLESIGLDFLVHSSDFTEKDTHLSAEDLAMHNAIGKAQQVGRHYKNALVIGADTIGVVGDHFLGKPQDHADHVRLIRLLSGTTHRVLTAICILDTNTHKCLTATETTLITMDRLEESEIEAYIASGEGADKAAGYAIQGLGSLFVKRIDGDYFNVVGLPLYRLRKMLKKLGFKLPITTKS